MSKIPTRVPVVNGCAMELDSWTAYESGDLVYRFAVDPEAIKRGDISSEEIHELTREREAAPGKWHWEVRDENGVDEAHEAAIRYLKMLHPNSSDEELEDRLESVFHHKDLQPEKCKHTPDMTTAQFADDATTESVIVDVWCSKCGESGSCKLTTDDLMFDD
jgi:hypothetical protein